MTKEKPPQHKHLKAGEVCGHCELRAPPTKLCRMCRKEVKDWPVDEIGYLEKQGWELVEFLWVEPREHVLRDPTPNMVADAMNLVNHYETMLANKSKEYWRNDKLIPLEIAKGLEKARTNLASLRSGERYECRPQLRLGQEQAVQAQYIRTHHYEPKTIDRTVPTYSDEQLATWTKQALARHKASDVKFLPEHERDTIEERRGRTTVVHHAMCSECRQY